jgi:hypothetical protein
MISLTANDREGTSRARHKYKEVIMRAQAISGPILAWLSRDKHCSCSTNVHNYSAFQSINTRLYICQGGILVWKKKKEVYG